MDDLLLDFDQLKISAFSKIRKINPQDIKNVTIGPNFSSGVKEKLTSTTLNTNDTKKSDNFSSNSAIGFPTRQVLKELEIRRQVEVKSAIQSHINKLEEFCNRQEAERKQKWLWQQEAFIEDLQRKESTIFKALNEYDKNTSNEHTKLVQHYQDLAERRRILEQELEANERRKQIINENIETIKKCQLEFRSVYQQIIVVIKTCLNSEHLKNLLGDSFKLLKTLPDGLEEVVIQCKNGRVTETEVNKASDLVVQVNNLKQKIEESVTIVNSETGVQPVVLSIPHVPSQVSSSPQLNQEVKSQSTIHAEKQESSSITEYVSLGNLKMYCDLMNFLDNHTKSFKELESDISQKQFKFDCKKAINIPVNSLSGINSEHILDKYTRLHQLLTGQNIVMSDKQINASRHPQGIAFCMDLLAKKFVLQGDLMISSNPESAFCYASVMVSLWNDFPTFGQLILAYFYKYCPYLIPYYVPRQVGETDEEFYTRQGYQYTGGNIERQDKFLKRMTGIMRLYSAILIAKPKRGQNNQPHNLQQGWRWLSSLLKLEPRVDITATMLHTFLETVGFEMDAKYKKMFQKLVAIIIKRILPSCREKCTGGAVTRLELLLNDYFKNKGFEKPNGYLGYSSW